MKVTFTTRSAAFVACSFAFAAWAVGDDFELPWSTIDGGGVMKSTGGGFELSSTIGQADAGRMTGGEWVLTGGFWFETLPGDFNSDGAVNLLDYAELAGCLAGPASTPNSACTPFDLNHDGHVDLEDFAQLQRNVKMGPLSGDFNSDGTVNLLDYAELAGCLAGPASTPNSACAPFDLNHDGHVDLEDFAQFQREVNGA